MDGSIDREISYEYNYHGRLSSERYVYNTGTYTFSDFKYDQNNNVVYKAGMVDDYFSGKSSFSYTYTYDANNKCAREIVDWTTSTDDITYKYDEQGSIIKEHSVYKSDSDIFETTRIMTPDYENGICVQNLIKNTTVDNYVTNTWYALEQYIYDDNGNKEKELYYTEAESANDTGNLVQVNGRYYKLSSYTEYTYENLKDVVVY